MPFDPNLLQQHLNDTDIVNLSDADAATLLSTPTLVPRTERITLTTMASVWGLDKSAACQEAFEVVKSNGGTNGAVANHFLSIVSGPGFDATDPQVQTKKDALLALAMGTIDSQDVINLLGKQVYRCGDVVNESDINAGRVILARRMSVSFLRDKVNHLCNYWVGNVLNPSEYDTSRELPTYTDFINLVQNG